MISTVARGEILTGKGDQLGRLVVAHLQEDQTARLDEGGIVAEDGAVEGQAVLPSVQRGEGLPMHLGGEAVDICGGDVGGIGQNGIVGRAGGEGCYAVGEEVGADGGEAFGHPVAACVFGGQRQGFGVQLQRVGRNVGAMDEGGYGDAPATRTEIHDTGIPWEELHGGLHQHLGVGAGDEAMLVDSEAAPEEFPLTQNILEGLAGQAAGDGGLQRGEIVEPVSMSHNCRAADTCDLLQKEACLEGGLLDACLGQRLGQRDVGIGHRISFR